jgi:hypothetical protein
LHNDNIRNFIQGLKQIEILQRTIVALIVSGCACRTKAEAGEELRSRQENTGL